MSIEQRYYDLLGVRKEYPNLNLIAITGLELFSRTFSWFRGGLEIEGAFPPEGPFIAYANHRGAGDIPRIYIALTRTSGRFLRGYTKATLLINGYKEPRSVRQNFDPMEHFPLNHLTKFFLGGSGAIPIRRGGISIEAFKLTRAALQNGEGIGLFLQQHRVKEGDLRELMNGVKFLGEKFPNVPFVPTGISGPPDGPYRIRIGSTFTYIEASQEPSYDATTESGFKLYAGDRLAPLISERVQNDWETRRLSLLDSSIKKPS